MEISELIDDWFLKWSNGDYQNLPLSEDFEHTSPYGTITGRSNYLALVEESEDLFTGNTFTIHDKIVNNEIGCVRYTMNSPTTKMAVSEWFYAKEGLIHKIIAYYDRVVEKEGGRGIEI